MSTFQHQPGTAIECLSIPIVLTKECVIGPDGQQILKCGFKVGGGIDQDYRQSPQGFTDNGIYITDVGFDGPAWKAGLRPGDKILQCNGYDFTICTHRKAIDYINRSPILNLLIARMGVTTS